MLTLLAEISTVLTLVVSVYALLEPRLPEIVRLPGSIPPMSLVYVVASLLAVALLANTWSASHNASRVETALQAPQKPDPSLGEMARVAIDLLNAARTTPQQIAEPYTAFSKKNAEAVNRLGELRHAGWKRYLEWIANYPNAAQNAEKWRQDVIDILRANYGAAVVSRFNTPTTHESERTGWLLPPSEHAHRVDRLGEIIDDIVKGKIPSGLGNK